ncbi:hypothetical protein H0H92_003406 [Tricholoma furcatifolium]|nr:hypothetical protein H0H92_003406 [Tricholoma furcatifolium]
MKKTVTPFTAQLITYQTSLSYEAVISRLNEAVNRTGSAGFLDHMALVTTKEGIVNLVANITAGSPWDFLYFMELDHSRWMNIFDAPDKYAPAVVYTIGNPVLAETFMRYDIRAGYEIPPKVMVLGNTSVGGTTVFYHRPSLLVVSNDTELLQAMQILDAKLDQMITNITTEA